MHPARTTFGLLIALLAAVGSVAAMAGIYGAWHVRHQFENRKDILSTRVDHALEQIESQVGEINRQIAEARTAIQQVDQRVGEFLAQASAGQISSEVGVIEVEQQFRLRLDRLNEWMQLTSSNVELLRQLAETLQALSSSSDVEPRTLLQLFSTIQSGQEELQRTVELVREIEQSLVALRDEDDSAAAQARIETLSGRISSSVERIADRGVEFEQAIHQTRTDLSELSNLLTQRSLQAAIGSTLLLIWLTAAQISLGIHARRFALTRMAADNGQATGETLPSGQN